MTPETFFSTLGSIAPLHLAESWDNVGLLLEATGGRPVRRVLLTIDLSEAVLEEAIELDVDTVVSYHPPLFSPLKRLTLSDPRERLALLIARANLHVYSPHTALDTAEGGLNDWLAACFEPPWNPSPVAVRALRPIDAARPRLGQGRLVELTTPLSVDQIVPRVKQYLSLKAVRLASAEREIRSIALCAGSGSSTLRGVRADLYFTGEMGHHDVLAALARNTSVILTEHSNSERGYLPQFKHQIEALTEGKLEVLVSKADREPLRSM